MRYLLLTLIIVGCAEKDNTTCAANFLGSGLSVKVDQLSAETYIFQLCGDSRQTVPAFTVYGAPTEAALTDPSITSRYRLSHVSADQNGDRFEVTFSSDLYFIIYADQLVGGQLQYAMTTELVRGSLSQILN